MTNSVDNRNNTEIQNLPWYNRPLWGNQSFFSWLKSLITIRQQYPFQEYKQPAIFSEEIPGLNIYEKYQSHVEKE